MERLILKYVLNIWLFFTYTLTISFCPPGHLLLLQTSCHISQILPYLLPYVTPKRGNLKDTLFRPFYQKPISLSSKNAQKMSSHSMCGLSCPHQIISYLWVGDLTNGESSTMHLVEFE